MTDKVCSCPGRGDGSLRWPCEAHPPNQNETKSGQGFCFTEAQVEAAAKAIADCHNPGMFEKYPENWKVEARAALAALDGAPEPEWEYGLASRTARIPNVIGISDNMPLRDEFGRVTVRRRKAGPWLPVEGESK